MGELVPFLLDYGYPIFSGLTAAGQALSQTGDPLKALLTGGGTAAAGIGLGKLGRAGGAGLTRMAGDVVDAPGWMGNVAAQVAANPGKVSNLLAGIGQSTGASLGQTVAGNVANVVPSVGSVANAALGAGGLAYNQMQPRPTGNVPAYQPPDISKYGPNGPYGTIANENPLGSAQGALRYQLDNARTWDEANKIIQPYVQKVSRQAYEEEMQRQAASYQQKSAVNTAAQMLGQAQLGGQQAGLNAQQAMNNAISGPQRSYF
jgi:hypothetical protein